MRPCSAEPVGRGGGAAGSCSKTTELCRNTASREGMFSYLVRMPVRLLQRGPASEVVESVEEDRRNEIYGHSGLSVGFWEEDRPLPLTLRAT